MLPGVLHHSCYRQELLELYLQSSSRATFNPPSNASELSIAHTAGEQCYHDSNHQEQFDCYATESIKIDMLVCTKEVLLHAMGRCCLPRSVCAIIPRPAYTLTSVSTYCNRLTLLLASIYTFRKAEDVR